MKISSNWKITFDPAGTPRVLVDFGDYLDGEIIWPLKRGFEVVPLVDSTVPFLRPSGNAIVTLAINVYTSEDLDKTARQRVMESLIEVGALARKPLKIEVAGITDRYWQFGNSYITDHQPIRVIESAFARLVKSYSITATGMAQVGP